MAIIDLAARGRGVQHGLALDLEHSSVVAIETRVTLVTVDQEIWPAVEVVID
jgi:hypothetical protein